MTTQTPQQKAIESKLIEELYNKYDIQMGISFKVFETLWFAISEEAEKQGVINYLEEFRNGDESVLMYSKALWKDEQNKARQEGAEQKKCINHKNNKAEFCAVCVAKFEQESANNKVKQIFDDIEHTAFIEHLNVEQQSELEDIKQKHLVKK